MQMNAQTTVTDLLFSGAFIEASCGESLTDLMAVDNDRDWVHNLPISKLIERNAVIHFRNGLSLSGKGHKLSLKNDFSADPVVEIENSDTGFETISRILSKKSESSFLKWKELPKELAFA